jgi:uncharacterized membrane protein YfcA
MWEFLVILVASALFGIALGLWEKFIDSNPVSLVVVLFVIGLVQYQELHKRIKKLEEKIEEKHHS